MRQRVNALENQLLSYRNGRARARGRLGKKYKTYRVGRVPFARLCLRGKTVIMYLALPYEKAAAAYKNVRDKSDIRKYQKFPSEVRIKSELALQKALRLIEQSALENGFEKNAPFVPLPYRRPCDGRTAGSGLYRAAQSIFCFSRAFGAGNLCGKTKRRAPFA